MKYYYRCWLWENGKKSTEYTDYMVAPFFYEDNLDDTLDTGEIVLDAMPISTKNAFPPKTKFRVERYLNADFSDIPSEKHKWDLMVEADNVEEYPSSPDICCHRINCIEASVYAQGVHVDNFALTYELQDVDMNYKVTKETGAVNNIKYSGALLSEPIISRDISIDTSAFWGSPSYTEWANSYMYEWDTSSLSELNGLNSIISSAVSTPITFTIPKLYCCGATTNGSWARLFQMNTITRIYRTALDPLTHGTLSETRVQIGSDIKSGALSFADRPVSTSESGHDVRYIIQNNKAYIREVKEVSRKESGTGTTSFGSLWLGTSASVVAVANSSYQQQVTFNTDAVDTEALDSEGNPINYGYKYDIEVLVDGSHIPYYHKANATVTLRNIVAVRTAWLKVVTKTDKVPSGTLRVYKSFTTEASTDSETTGGAFLVKGTKYSCFDVIRKALLTADTQIINNSEVGLDSVLDIYGEELGIQYPIIIKDTSLITKLKNCSIHETIFEQKNLWEVLLQVGYYLHAVPYLTFAEDGTDRFVLNFKQLGSSVEGFDDSTKITVFNSRNLSEYFSAFDTYVTNMFSPQNEIEEWIVPKTSDSSFLISNDTAELQCCYPITEIVSFEITYNGTTKNALSYIFEKSIYEILSSENPQYISPAKGCALYYSLGDNKILGLNYVSPCVNNENLSSLKQIVKKLFRITESSAASLKFNDLSFKIKYRTQDSMRVKQFRPDIDSFMKNSSYEKYPHSEQFFGQQDKIVDSERLGANLWGKLIRTGNGIYQRQEYCDVYTEEKESGELVELYGEPYYVTKIENEYYNDGTFQKVTYSKNFNQISQVVTIPSEPRFYEVSERSTVRREVFMTEFIKISSKTLGSVSKPRYVNSSVFINFIRNNIFNAGNRYLPNFAYVRFHSDIKRDHTNQYDMPIDDSQLFPSSEVERDGTSVYPKGASDHVDVIVPAIHYPFRNSLIFEWDMADNFKAGDFIDTEISGTTNANTNDGAYYALQSMRYCDVLGRADLFQFKLTNKNSFTLDQVRAMPRCLEIPTDANSPFLVAGNQSVGLDKDCREAISFNLQINLAYNQDDGFIVYPNIWGEKNSSNKLKLCLCSKKKSLFDINNSDVLADGNQILLDDIQYSISESNGQIVINFKNNVSSSFDLSEVNSVCFYDQDDTGTKFAYIVRNVNNLDNNQKLNDWYIYPIYND